MSPSARLKSPPLEGRFSPVGHLSGDCWLSDVTEERPPLLPTRPSDMARIAIYLASKAGAYVTGAVIPVDGGISTTK